MNTNISFEIKFTVLCVSNITALIAFEFCGLTIHNECESTLALRDSNKRLLFILAVNEYNVATISSSFLNVKTLIHTDLLYSGTFTFCPHTRFFISSFSVNRSLSPPGWGMLVGEGRHGWICEYGCRRVFGVWTCDVTLLNILSHSSIHPYRLSLF